MIRIIKLFFVANILLGMLVGCSNNAIPEIPKINPETIKHLDIETMDVTEDVIPEPIKTLSPEMATATAVATAEEEYVARLLESIEVQYEMMNVGRNMESGTLPEVMSDPEFVKSFHEHTTELTTIAEEIAYGWETPDKYWKLKDEFRMIADHYRSARDSTLEAIETDHLENSNLRRVYGIVEDRLRKFERFLKGETKNTQYYDPNLYSK